MDVFSFYGLFPFPSQELFEKNMPQKFSEYHTTRIILTCNEIFVQQPSAMLAWKVFVGVTPNIQVSLILVLWRGQVSDREPNYKGKWCS